MKQFSSLAAATSLALGLCSAAQAVPMQFDAVGDSFTVSFAPDVGAGRSLSASLTYTLESVNHGDAVFKVDVSNTSSGLGNNALSSFGVVAITPDPLSVRDTDPLWDTYAHRTLGGQQVDFCARVDMGMSALPGAPRISCNNSSFAFALPQGDSSTLNFTLSFGNAFNIATNDISFDGFVVRFLDVGLASGVRSLVTSFVPEPGSLALVVLALLSFQALRRRRA